MMKSVVRGARVSVLSAVYVLASCTGSDRHGGHAAALFACWSIVATFNEDGDTLQYLSGTVTLVLTEDGEFQEIRGDTVVDRGVFAFECDLAEARAAANDLCLQFPQPSRLFTSAPYWGVELLGDTLVLRNLENDGWSLFLSREESVAEAS